MKLYKMPRLQCTIHYFLKMYFRSCNMFALLILLPFASCTIGDIALKKCKEYTNSLFALTGGNTCPRVPVPLIIGGSPAAIMEFPHMAAIGFGRSPNAQLSWHCGGTLISENFVLTAAHCLKSRDKGPSQKVRFGDVYMDNELGSEVLEYYIRQRIEHPHYKPPSKYNDIALLELDGRVQFTLNIRPACLHVDYNIYSSTVIATGYGKQSYAFYEVSPLQKVELPILSHEACNRAFAPDIRRTLSVLENGIINSQLCVGDLAGGRDTCQGDSGGPIQIPLPWTPCMYEIVGVTSFGKFCGFPNAPSIYTRVSSYVDWIERIVWRNKSVSK